MYESDTSSVVSALQGSSTTVFSDQTISQILALTQTDNATVRFDQVTADVNGNVSVPSGAEVVLIGSSDTFTTTVTPPKNAPVVIFQGRGGVVATINDGVTVPSSNQTHVDRVVVGTAGNDKIIVADARNTKVILGSGNSTVTTGSGVDTVEAGLGNSTITGGSGDYAVVKLSGSATNYTVTVNNGHAVVTDNTTTKVTDISKIQYVQLDSGKALVFAKDSVEASVAALYHAAFGRDSDAAGLNYWFDAAKAGVSLVNIANSFANSQEFVAAHIGQDNTAFIKSLYNNTFGRDPEDAGLAYWVSQLDSGQSKGAIIASFAQIAGQNIAGTNVHQEATVVGSVTIVHNIV